MAVVRIDPKVIEDMTETIQLLQKEINEMKIKLQEVEIAKRDQELMDNLNKIRDKEKERNLVACIELYILGMGLPYRWSLFALRCSFLL